MTTKETYKIKFNIVDSGNSWFHCNEFNVEIETPLSKKKNNHDAAWKAGWMKITTEHPGKSFSILSVTCA